MNVKHEPIITSDEARAIARDAYIYGFPLVDNYRVLYSYFVDQAGPEYKAPWNQLHNTARVYTPGDKAVQTPNSDTPYSQLGADLRAEPLVLTVPEVEEGRYFSLQFVDLYTYNFAYVGSRATGNGGGSFLLAGPNWNGEQPPGITGVIRAETELVFVLYRTQLFAPDDIDNVKKVQAGFTVQTLSAFLGTEAPEAAPKINFPRPLTPTGERNSLSFFNILNFVLQFCPTHRSERDLVARFSDIGIGAGRTFDSQRFSPALRKTLEDGVGDAWLAYAETDKLLANGEMTSADIFGTRAYLRNNYILRMVAAVDGIYGNSKEEAIYPAYVIDSTGQRLDGAKNRYMLRFAPDQLPPVNAFWSLTMYELPSRMLVANTLDRYLINSSTLPGLVRDADGGLTIYVQRESPTPDKKSNWLPAPNGAFMMALRLYWPKPAALEKSWKNPPLQRVNAKGNA